MAKENCKAVASQECQWTSKPVFPKVDIEGVRTWINHGNCTLKKISKEDVLNAVKAGFDDAKSGLEAVFRNSYPHKSEEYAEVCKPPHLAFCSMKDNKVRKCSPQKASLLQ